MPPKKQEVSTSLSVLLYQRLQEFRQERSCADDSEAIALILSEYFGPEPSPSPANAELPAGSIPDRIQAVEHQLSAVIQVLMKSTLAVLLKEAIAATEAPAAVETPKDDDEPDAEDEDEKGTGEVEGAIAATKPPLTEEEELETEDEQDEGNEEAATEQTPTGEDQAGEVEGAIAGQDKGEGEEQPQSTYSRNFLRLRLKVRPKRLDRHRDEPNFTDWSRQQDPNGIGWRYLPNSNRYAPEKELPDGGRLGRR